VRFLIDAQLPPAFAESFRREGHEGIPVRDVGLRDASDGEIWRYARAEGLVIVSKDEDFALRVRRSGPPPSVLWLRVGNVSTRALTEWFEPLLLGIVVGFAAGEALIEVR
jgi:predicted nuclease of predicted toxin-antitoxin system